MRGGSVLRGEHAGNGVFLPDGKTRKPYEFGVKSALAVSHQHGLMLGARTFPGNPYDGHILSAALEQTTNLTQDVGLKLKHIVVDLGFRGVDADNPDKEIIHRGKYKRLGARQKGWLRRRPAIEPAIGHLKPDHRMDRCWLQGALGDALHAISCAAGYNLRWPNCLGRGLKNEFCRDDYIATDEDWLYLVAVIDLFSRQVMGWSLQSHMQAGLVKDALAMAWWRRRPPPGLIFHSDRGSPVLQRRVPERFEVLTSTPTACSTAACH